MHGSIKKQPLRLSLAGAILLLAGCASFTPDAGFDSVKTSVEERAGMAPRWVRNERDAGEVREAVQRTLTAGPLTADAAVQIALMNNPGLQATYGDVGIAEADLVQAGRLANPGFCTAEPAAATRSKSSGRSPQTSSVFSRCPCGPGSNAGASM